MKEVFKEIPFGIEHTLKVLKNAEDIMKGENIGEEEKEFISIHLKLMDLIFKYNGKLICLKI